MEPFRIHGSSVVLSLCSASLWRITNRWRSGRETHVSGNSTGLLLILLCSARMYSSIKGHWGQRNGEEIMHQLSRKHKMESGVFQAENQTCYMLVISFAISFLFLYPEEGLTFPNTKQYSVTPIAHTSRACNRAQILILQHTLHVLSSVKSVTCLFSIQY